MACCVGGSRTFCLLVLFVVCCWAGMQPTSAAFSRSKFALHTQAHRTLESSRAPREECRLVHTDFMTPTRTASPIFVPNNRCNLVTDEERSSDSFPLKAVFDSDAWALVEKENAEWCTAHAAQEVRTEQPPVVSAVAFRGDSRPPQEIFVRGFEPADLVSSF